MPKAYKFLSLGDSYSIGESVKEQERWPVQLYERLKSNKVHIMEPQIIAKTGWTTDELLQAIRSEDIKEDFDLVSLLIGVNNQYRGYSLDEYRKEFETLLKLAVRFAGNNPEKVFVLSIPDYGMTPFAEKHNPLKIAKEIDDFNIVNKRVTESFSVSYFDITAISRKAKNENSLIASDGLHPSGKMYKLWIDLIFQEVISKIKE